MTTTVTGESSEPLPWPGVAALAEDVDALVLQADPQGIVRRASASVTALTGRSADQVLGRPISALVHPADAEDIATVVAAAIDTGTQRRLTCRVPTASGRSRAMTLVVRTLADPNGGHAIVLAVLRDDQERLAALRALTTLSRANRMLVRTDDEADLMDRMCRTIATAGHYPLVWYGRPVDDEQRSVAVVAAAGDHTGYLDRISVSWGDNDLGRGPTGRALRTGETQVLDTFEQDPGFVPWRAAASREGFACSIALPVRVHGRIDGALMVYADEPGSFDELARELLQDLAADLGYGLSRLRDSADLQAALARVEESELRYRLLVENASDAVVLVDENRVVQWASASITTTFGHRVDTVTGVGFESLVHPDDRSRVAEAVEHAAGSGRSVAVRYRVRCGDGTYRWVASLGREVTGEGGQRLGRVVALRDVEEQVRAETELETRERQYRLLAENASDVVWLIAPDGVLEWTSESVTAVLGWRPDELVGRLGMDLVHPDDRVRAMAARAYPMRGGTSTGEYRMLCSDGSHRWMYLTVRGVSSPEGMSRVVGMRDVEDEVAARTALTRAVGRDPLTQLPTRQTFLTRAAEVAEALPHGSTFAVLCVGLDDLRSVNDALTHAGGDRELEHMAARIAEVVGRSDRLARGSGDTFLVLLPSVSEPGEAAAMAERVLQAARQPIEIAGHRLEPTVSVGIATAERGADLERLLRDADLAMRQAKAEGRDRWSFIDRSLAADAQRRLTIEAGLRQALRDDRLVAWLQPIVSLPAGTVSGYEALVRRVNDDGSVSVPADFLSVAESSGLVTQLDEAILRQAVDRLRRLPSTQFVSVNASPASLQRPDYTELVLQVLAHHGVHPGRLHLEVTETTLLTVTEGVRASMTSLANAGIRWYVDDFGTGYSSLSHLRDLPVSGLKLDMSFTAGIRTGDSTCVQVAQGLAGLADGLQLDTVAEGVETATEAAVLAAQGWRHAQGWLYGRPAPEPQAES